MTTSPSLFPMRLWWRRLKICYRTLFTIKKSKNRPRCHKSCRFRSRFQLADKNRLYIQYKGLDTLRSCSGSSSPGTKTPARLWSVLRSAILFASDSPFHGEVDSSTDRGCFPLGWGPLIFAERLGPYSRILFPGRHRSPKLVPRIELTWYTLEKVFWIA
jgi:hypothetical protein